MAGLVLAIYVLRIVRETWMPATSAGMTVLGKLPPHGEEARKRRLEP